MVGAKDNDATLVPIIHLLAIIATLTAARMAATWLGSQTIPICGATTSAQNGNLSLKFKDVGSK